MPSAWYMSRQKEVAQLERRKALLGRSRAGALVGAYSLIAVTVALTTILFAAVVRLGSGAQAPQMTSVEGDQGLVVVQADPVPLSQVGVSLSRPGRVLLDGAPGDLVAGVEAPLATQGRLAPGSTLRVCTSLPSPSVELVLRDRASGALLERHTFAAPAACP